MVVRTKGLTANAQCMCDSHTYGGRSCFITILILDMTVNKNEQTLSLTVTEGLTVTILPNSSHEYLMTTLDVAAGYGVSKGTIRMHQLTHHDELIEGKHYIKGVNITDTLINAQPSKVFWTKAGVIRLGFFIKSERAKLFRDWAEQLILAVVGHKQPLLPEIAKRRINRLTPDRIIDILSDVCLIEDKNLRERIATKIKGGYSYGN